jgi:hypothetical protein
VLLLIEWLLFEVIDISPKLPMKTKKYTLSFALLARVRSRLSHVLFPMLKTICCFFAQAAVIPRFHHQFLRLSEYLFLTGHLYIPHSREGQLLSSHYKEVDTICMA